ncbi:FISUMP domain-containing protein [Riemerella anatipestifer]|nr:FISUMP domain-containing protein [Riemerella anatipestifer]
MKKTLLCAVFLPLVLNAQDYSGRVGINTDKPKATLEISKVAVSPTMPATKAQGVLFPKFTSEERLKFSGTAEVGTVIYNADKKCLEMYLGIDSGVHQWACLPDVGSSKAQSVAVTAAGFEGSYVGGVPFNDANKAKFKLENNSFSTVSSSFADAVTVQNGSANISAGNCQWQKLNGSTPTGEVKNCASPSLITLNSGESALLTYTMSGTPATGTLTANFNKLGAQADQSTAVGLGTASITSPKTEYVVSLVYDGTTPKTEVQGKINNTSNKLIVKIPYENGSGSYNEVTSQPIATTAGQDNDSNTLTLNIPAGNFGVNGYLDATITVGGNDQEYLVKMLPPGQEYTIATIPYTLNGNNYEVVLKGIGGIPDKKFNVLTNGKLEHQFVYVPIKGSDGRTWLNNNLGADYANLNSPVFNPLQQATSIRDKNAYGSHFQWGRDADGHELVTYPTATTGNRVYPNISFSYDFQLNVYTNPCPDGYRVPTQEEFRDYFYYHIPADGGSWKGPQLFSDPLKFTYAGKLDGAGNWDTSFLVEWGYGGIYWTSSPVNSYDAWSFSLKDERVSLGYNYGGGRQIGCSIRCIKD